MKRRTKGLLLVGGLTVATVVGLAAALAALPDPRHYCQTGFTRLVSCTAQWHQTVTRQGTPIFPTPADSTVAPLSDSGETSKPISFDAMLWAVADCPRNYIARRLLCQTPAVASPVETLPDDLAASLPLPKPWVVRTAKNTPFIEAVHVETLLDLEAMLGFYRHELGKRGWSENSGAVVAPDRVTITFTTTDGPALLRLIHQDDRTIADLSRHKPADTTPGIRPQPGQARLLLGNTTDEDAIITINEQTFELAAQAGRKLMADDSKSPDSPDINLPPGKYNVTFKIANGTVQSREFEVVADESWGLLVGPAGVPLPVRLY